MRPAALLAAWLPITAALARAQFPQTTTEPASAWMRAAGALLEHQAPWVVAALVVVQGLLLVSALRLRTRDTPSSATAAGAMPAVPPAKPPLGSKLKLETATERIERELGYFAEARYFAAFARESKRGIIR